MFLGSAYVSQPFVAAVDAWRLQSAPCSCFWRVLAALGGCRQALSSPTRLQRAALIRQFINASKINWKSFPKWRWHGPRTPQNQSQMAPGGLPEASRRPPESGNESGDLFCFCFSPLGARLLFWGRCLCFFEAPPENNFEFFSGPGGSNIAPKSFQI